jgi:hypothetical protein
VGTSHKAGTPGTERDIAFLQLAVKGLSKIEILVSMESNITISKQKKKRTKKSKINKQF